MSTIGARAKREERAADAAPATAITERPAPVWRGFVVVVGADGTRWARVALPESVMRAHLVGDVEPPNLRGVVASRIETEIGSDAFIEGRGWRR